MTAFAEYANEHLLSQYSNLPHGRYVSLFIVRKTESETIFRTEGSGEGLVKDIVSAGHDNPEAIRRVVISKRKQTAVERRTGRELLREFKLLKKPPSENKKAEQYSECMLNTNAPCEQCIDCYLYGFAAGGGGAQRSRVLTDDAYSIAPAYQITAKRTFNATFDNGTMRNPVTGEASTSINEDEFVIPQTHFLDIETLKDVTLAELQYVIGNIMRSNRYGAITSRLGKVSNRIIGVAFSTCELFSNLELTQVAFDQLMAAARKKQADAEDLPFPLADTDVDAAVHTATDRLISQVFSRKPLLLRGDALRAQLAGVQAMYDEPTQIGDALRGLDSIYQEMRTKQEAQKAARNQAKKK